VATKKKKIAPKKAAAKSKPKKSKATKVKSKVAKSKNKKVTLKAKTSAAKKNQKKTGQAKKIAKAKTGATRSAVTNHLKTDKRRSTQDFDWSTAVTPLADNVVILQDEAELKTPGGLIIPSMAKDKPKKGVVVAAGPGRYDKRGKIQKMDLKVGDSVLFSGFAGSKVFISEREALFLKESDILGVIES
jgi:chaperonin GroES